MLENNISKEFNDKAWKAAYALNMCTVSVSQIIDYNDSYILEQEYDAILNNLDLEKMPKDEALLNILTELLNVVTFFRIQDIKKQQIEAKYKRRMQNAIWSAVPRIGVVGFNLPSIVVSLVSQIGIGYMNYRREKANAKADVQDQEIELQITAIEQFNALRRELFTTAWRLSAEYNFEDRYRLTEKQITQYNEILMDPDDMRRFDRLYAVRGKFEAYLPFWYFLGHAAKLISENPENNLSHESRDYYKQEARNCFEKYYVYNSYNILREDEITASLALEYIDLLLLDEHPDKEKICKLIELAVDKAGNANDVLQLCAISYLKIGGTENISNACDLFRVLINENYNKETNGKLLSRIYVSQFLSGKYPQAKTNYEILSRRVNIHDLFPMPMDRMENTLEQDTILVDKYLTSQKRELLWDYRFTMAQFIKKYASIFYEILPNAQSKLADGHVLFENLNAARLERRIYGKSSMNISVFGSTASGINDVKSASEFNYGLAYINATNDMLRALDGIQPFRDNNSKDYLITLLEDSLVSADIKISKFIAEGSGSADFKESLFILIQNEFSCENITKEFFDEVEDSFAQTVNSIDSLSMLDNLQMELDVFILEQGLKVRRRKGEFITDDNHVSNEYGYTSYRILDNSKSERAIFNEKVTAFKRRENNLIVNSDIVKLLVYTSNDFDEYFSNINTEVEALKTKTFAIFTDIATDGEDMLLTIDGLIPIIQNEMQSIRPYSVIRKNGKALDLGWPDSYSNEGINMEELYGLVEELGKMES